ncbi:phosphoribosyl-ATP diphosphatase [Paracoccaceae bacterium]|nr:phosphoribosyl-ATP diphosphatase [Paracoccaceae bacterium]MDC0582692.1 phosphoribosyl-ATP diphosphatase [Paracoccaceae bacterium]MED7677211.1 phosphoribosyl-ATP diphosphatase [Rhodobacteraceae bacterium IMCC15231]
MTLEQLENLIAQRSSAPSSESWTAQLLEKGAEKCAEKFGEEAVELIIEAVKNDSNGLINEAADVMYHLLVLLKSREISLSHVMAELERRTAQSGLTEKAARKI